jgi:hypothetical protein
MGYKYNVDSENQNYYIIHDGWSYADVYRNWDSDDNYIEGLYTIKN